jgi:sensor c-di-GMP phosphodiesterase-like protein
MNMHVIGEGVETAEQVDVLRAIGTDSLQGNFISPPLPGPEFAAFVASHDAGVFPAIRRRRLASGPAADRMAGYWS